MTKILICTVVMLLLCSSVFANAKVKVLSIGNSFSHDAFSYVPFLMKDIDPEMELTLAIAAIGGCTVEQHATFSQTNEEKYDYHKYIPGATTWHHEGPISVKKAIQDEAWDIIIIQQQSERSQRYDTYQPYLNNFIDYIFKTVNKPVKLVWHLTPSYGHEPFEGLDMYRRIAICAQQVLKDTPVEFVIPNGTAIQNARGTYLKELGDKGHLSGDNLHMQEGLPRQIEAYTTILSLLKLTGREYISIYGNKTICSDEWLEGKKTWTTGKSVGSVLENLETAQKCAIMAMKNPFEVSEIK